MVVGEGQETTNGPASELRVSLGVGRLHEQVTEVRIGLSLLSETVTRVTDDCSKSD